MTGKPSTCIWLVLLLGVIMSAGCGDNTLSSGANEKKASATVHVRSIDGSPLESVIVTLKNTWKTDTTDSTGSVEFTDIKPGTYEIGISREDIPESWHQYHLAGRNSEISLTVAPQLDIRVAIQDKDGPPLKNANVLISSTTNKSTTDENGLCTFSNVVTGNLSFSVNCSSFSTKSRSIVYYNAQTDNTEPLRLTVVVDIPPPRIRINSPIVTPVNFPDLILSCEATDVFGETIPDSLIVWKEDSLGEIGRGSIMKEPPYKTGRWTVNVEATDIYGYKNAKDINFSAYYSNPESYFPTPQTGTWMYRYENPEIIIAYENHTELLVFSDIRVTMLDGNRRETTVEYEIHAVDDIDYAEYTVTDWFSVSRDSIAVCYTQEKLNLWDKPSEEFSTEKKSWITYSANYNRPILIMADAGAPAPGEQYTTMCTATVKQSVFDGLNSFTPGFKIPITTICTIGERETITVDGNTYDTVPVTIQQNDTIKRWWLVSGTGIVRMEHPLSGIDMRADLVSVELGAFAPTEKPSLPVFRHAPTTDMPVGRTVRATAPGIEAHLDLLRTLIR